METQVPVETLESQESLVHQGLLELLESLEVLVRWETKDLRDPRDL